MSNDAENKNLTIVASVSKSGNRLVVGVPKKFEPAALAYFGKPVRVTLEPLL